VHGAACQVCMGACPAAPLATPALIAPSLALIRTRCLPATCLFSATHSKLPLQLSNPLPPPLVQQQLKQKQQHQ
jgi:hypothetical protein